MKHWIKKITQFFSSLGLGPAHKPQKDPMHCNCNQSAIHQILDYFCGHHRHHSNVALKVRYSNGTTVIGKNMTTIVRVDQQVVFSPVFADKFGNTNVVLGSVPTWVLADTTLATLAVSDDGLVCTVTPTGTEGTTQVQLSVDADAGDGVTTLTGTADLQFVAGQALAVVFNPVVSTPAPAPTV